MSVLSNSDCFESVLKQRLDLYPPDLMVDALPEFPAFKTFREAAVLIPIQWKVGGAQIILTQRAAHLNYHAGQISFPGGKQDQEDASPIETALREAEEEIGIPREKVRVIGALRPQKTITGFSIVPVIGVVENDVALSPSQEEVAHIVELPLAVALDLNRYIHRQYLERTILALDFLPFYVWGATANILLQFARLMQWDEHHSDD